MTRHRCIEYVITKENCAPVYSANTVHRPTHTGEDSVIYSQAAKQARGDCFIQVYK